MSAIPQSILDVKRPANTAVLDTHTDSNRRYVVRRRATSEELAAKPGVKYKETVGYIIGGSFVAREAKQEKSGQKSVTVSYGAAALVLMFALVVFKDLKKVFSCLDAMLYTVLATLKVLHPRVTAHTMKRHYERDYTSVVFPHMRLSQNKVGETYRSLGLPNQGYRLDTHPILNLVIQSSTYNSNAPLPRYPSTPTLVSLDRDESNRSKRNSTEHILTQFPCIFAHSHRT